MANDDPISCGPCLAKIVSSQLQPEQIQWAEIGVERALCIACKQALQEHIHNIVIIDPEKQTETG